MPDFLTLIKDFFQYKKLILSQRFLYFFLSSLITGMAYLAGYYLLMLAIFGGSVVLFWIAMWMFPWEKSYFAKVDQGFEQYDSDALKVLISNPPFLLSFPANIKFNLFKVNFYTMMATVDIKKAFETFQKLNEFYLLPEEKIQVTLRLAGFYHFVANVKMLKETLLKINENDLSSEQKFLYQLYKSFVKELNGDIDGAKNELYKLLENSPKNRQSQLFNNLARLEEMTGNTTQALHYYEKAGEALIQEPKPVLYHIIYHNLVIINAKLNKQEEAKRWMNIYESAVDKSILEVYIEYLNTQVFLARQLYDRILLVEAYKKMDLEIAPKLIRDRWLAHFISKIRMSYSDDINFQDNIMQAEFLFGELKALEFPKNYFAAKEIFHLLKNLAERNQIGSMGIFFEKVIAFMSDMNEIIKTYRKTLPDLAVGEQWFWLQEQNFLHKFVIFSKPDKENFEIYFREIQEMARIAKNYENSYFETKAFMIICDEYLAYCHSLEEKFCSDFQTIAIEALKKASTKMDENQDNYQFIEFLIPLGFYFKYIGLDIQKASSYLKLFEDKYIAITQYAPWIQKYYEDLKKYG